MSVAGQGRGRTPAGTCPWPTCGSGPGCHQLVEPEGLRRGHREHHQDLGARADPEVHRLTGGLRQRLQRGQGPGVAEVLLGPPAQHDDHGTELVTLAAGILHQQSAGAQRPRQAMRRADRQPGRGRQLAHAQAAVRPLEAVQDRQSPFHRLRARAGVAASVAAGCHGRMIARPASRSRPTHRAIRPCGIWSRHVENPIMSIRFTVKTRRRVRRQWLSLLLAVGLHGRGLWGRRRRRGRGGRRERRGAGERRRCRAQWDPPARLLPQRHPRPGDHRRAGRASSRTPSATVSTSSSTPSTPAVRRSRR